jgi:hypothetical protein
MMPTFHKMLQASKNNKSIAIQIVRLSSSMPYRVEVMRAGTEVVYKEKAETGLMEQEDCTIGAKEGRRERQLYLGQQEMRNKGLFIATAEEEIRQIHRCQPDPSNFPI